MRRSTNDLDQRLGRRRAIEAELNDGRARERGDFLLRYEHIVAPLVRTAFQVTGLYWRGLRNARSPIIRRRRFEFANLPEGLAGFRILQLADLHLDGIDGLAEAVTRRIVGLDVDLCVMTGDYRFHVTGNCDAVYPRLGTILAAVKARHGTVAILGNHDAAEIAGGLEELGVRMLINESIAIRHGDETLWVAGVDDPHFYRCDDLPAAIAAIPEHAFKILLAHSPERFEEASQSGVALYLCGHTHGGQICLPLLGAPILNAACPRAYAHGAWRHGNVQGYTSAGIGCSMLPLRYNCPPEITILELARPSGGIR